MGNEVGTKPKYRKNVQYKRKGNLGVTHVMGRGRYTKVKEASGGKNGSDW